MSSTVQPISERPATTAVGLARHSLLGDYSQLFKVRVTSLVVMTAWTGCFMGAAKSGTPSLSLHLLNALVGIGLTAAGAAALNEVVEHRVDAQMARTKNRPLPAKRMTLATGITAGLLTALGGPLYLAWTTNRLTALLAFLTAATYLALYTPLKKVSPVSTFVGAFPGAMPPLLGWTAMRGTLEWEAVVLFAIVFAWQFPHFQAIAWLYREDYAAGGIRMLPVVDSAGRIVVRQMLAYSTALLPISLLPTGLHMAGRVYAIAALLLGLLFLWFSLRLALAGLPATAPESKKFARQLLQASVLYLPLLFAFMMFNVVRS
ncbi:MAG TPA: heme o synthase [Candidatus Saccharimonadales bacterium]|jgi:protoheme IX farnesyltransferase|nr:heme o synthase [Candidatus Saccharimonadales bacterium]